MDKSIYLFVSLIIGCSSFYYNNKPEVYYSSRDVTPLEWSILQKEYLSETPYSQATRSPANWLNSCLNAVTQFLGPKPSVNVHGVNLDDYQTLPLLSQLKSQEASFKNGKKYLIYQASEAILHNNSEYKEFLKDTIEIIFEPIDPFGHINLRVGEKIYSFSNVRYTSLHQFTPRMRPSSNLDKLPHSHGFVFNVGRDQIQKHVKEIEQFYKSSGSHNIPPFDAYSSDLKVSTTSSGQLKYISDAPKYGNNEMINGKIQEMDGHFFLVATNGMRWPIKKQGDEFVSESFSCSSSAGRILKDFFNLNLSHDYSAKSLMESLSKGNIGEVKSPVVVMKYYEE